MKRARVSLLVGIATAVAATTVAPATSVGVDPTGNPAHASPVAANPESSGRPSPGTTTPGQRLTIPYPAEEPDLVPFEPTGAPSAVSRHKGVVVKLWLERPSVGQGEWIQAVVRTTNTRKDPAWMWPGECGGSSTDIRVDLSRVVDPGTPQEGKARAFKRRAIRNAASNLDRFSMWEPPREGSEEWMFIECPPPLRPAWKRLRPGVTMEERFSWYPTRHLELGEEFALPLPPGPVVVHAVVKYVGRGMPPPDHLTAAGRPDTSLIEPITATAQLELSGVDPGAPSVPELIDSALAIPEFAAWVEAHTSRRFWNTSVGGWAADTPLGVPRWQVLVGIEHDGFVEVQLNQRVAGVDHRTAVALIDPWTAEVLAVGYQ